MDDAGSEEKNVVFLVLDSLRKDRISPYNGDVDFTPHIGDLADDAVVFEDAVAQAPWTLPSHASMFTGEYPWEHGTTHARSYFPADRETFIARFRDAGYHTAAITPNVWITPHKGMTDDFDEVENFLGTADNPLSVRLSRLGARAFHALGSGTRRLIGRQLDRVFRLFDVDDSCKSAETVDAVEDFLDDRDEGAEPFFLYTNLMEPHEPYHPPRRYQEKHGVDEDAAIPHRQKDVFTMDDIDYDALRRVYDASVDYTDDLVGRIRDALEENGLADDTVVVLLSDHGQALGGADGSFGHQFTVSEPVTNAVLLVDDPDREAGRAAGLTELRRLHDLVPGWAGIAPDPEPGSATVEIARGGIEYPENFTGFIPTEAWDDYYCKYRYVANADHKVVKRIDADGAATYTAVDRETGESVPVPAALRAEVDAIGDVDVDADGDAPEGREGGPETDEEIAERLEALGYK